MASSNQDSPTPPRLDPGAVEARDEAVEPTWTGDLLAGRQLGEYRVVQRIGSGGMGVVYEAEQPVIGRKVAIKVLRGDVVPGRGLLDEARAANQVRHRGIVDIYGFGELEGIGQYLVMELLEGKPLDAVLHEEGALRPADAVYILDEVLAPLEAAHARGVVHRDLKPSNVFLVSEPGGGRYVKLLDFGLARQMSVTGDRKRQTRVTGLIGTPHYMAPEQVRNFLVGPRTDLWAVGVIAYELLTGRMPFDGKDPFEVMTQVVSGTPRAVRSWVNVPAELDELVMKLLAKSPETRPHSAQVVRGLLKRIRRELSDAQTQLFKNAPRTPTYQEVPAAQVTPHLPPSLLPPSRVAALAAPSAGDISKTPVSPLPQPDLPLPPDTLDLSSQPDLQSQVRTDVAVVVPPEVLKRRGGKGPPSGVGRSWSKVLGVGAVLAVAVGATVFVWAFLQAPRPGPLPAQPLPLTTRPPPQPARPPPPPEVPLPSLVVPASALSEMEMEMEMVVENPPGLGEEDAGVEAADGGEEADGGEPSDAGERGDAGETAGAGEATDAGERSDSAGASLQDTEVDAGTAPTAETTKVRKKPPPRRIIIHRAGSGL